VAVTIDDHASFLSETDVELLLDRAAITAVHNCELRLAWLG